MTTHVMDELEKCDNLGMIRDGKIIAAGSPNELKTSSSSTSIEGAFLYFIGEEK